MPHGGDRSPAVTLAEAADEFLSSPRAASPTPAGPTPASWTAWRPSSARPAGPRRVRRRDRSRAAPPAGRPAPATWNCNRAAVASGLTWRAARKRWPAPQLPPTPSGARRTRRHQGAAPAASSGCCPAATSAAGEDAVADAVRDRRPGQRDPRPQRRGPRPRAAPGACPVQGRRHRVRRLGHRDRAPAARLLRLPDGHLTRQRAAVPRRPQARPRARWPAPREHPPRTPAGAASATTAPGSCSRSTPAAIWTCTSSATPAATHLGDEKVPLQLIMAKTRHKSPRTVMRYVKPGDEGDPGESADTIRWHRGPEPVCPAPRC